MKKYFLLLLNLFVAALNFNIILKSLHLVVGGTQGLSIIISQITKQDTSLIILIINIIMFLLSLTLLEKKVTLSIIISSFIYPLFVKITSFINFDLNYDYKLIYVLLSGIICGITCGFIYKLGFSTGGVSVLPLILKKYLNIKIFITTFIMNLIIILVGVYYFGIEKEIYGLVVIILNSLLIKIILTGNLRKKNYA